jgi:ribonuclease HIII
MSPQEILVFKLSLAEGKKLHGALNRDSTWEFRQVDHAAFQARGEGVIVTLYNSGKLVVQGRGAEGFTVRYLGDAAPVKRANSSASTQASDVEHQGSLSAEREPDVDYAGSDEAGKGDSFGGITVAAVFVPHTKIAELLEAGVCDSKQLSDKRVRILAPWIRDNYQTSEQVLSAADYNRDHAAHGSNVNKLLAHLHSKVLGELMNISSPGLLVVDRFGANRPVSAAMKDCGVPIKEVPRAEEWAAVAAASVLARESFIVSLASHCLDSGIDLPLGSGAPVKRVLREVKSIHSAKAWPRFCKMHFKNVKAALNS